MYLLISKLRRMLLISPVLSRIELGRRREMERAETLQPLPRLKPNSSVHDFDLRGDEKLLFQDVVTAYGIRAVWYPDLQAQRNLHLSH